MNIIRFISFYKKVMWYKVKKVRIWVNWVEKQIYPAGWKPWANTIAYYPLETDGKDYSWNNRDWNVGSGVSFVNLSWVSCASFNNTANGLINWSIWLSASDATMSAWFNSSNASNLYSMVSIIWDSASIQARLNNWTTLQWDIWTWSSDVTVSDWNCRDGNWHNTIVTYNRQKLILYLDWNKIWEANANINIPLTSFWIWWHLTPYSTVFPFSWYISRVIYESQARTASEVSDYYNLTKSKYGL